MSLAGTVAPFLLGRVYAIYTWMICSVLIRSTARQFSARSSWAKTEREPLETADV